MRQLIRMLLLCLLGVSFLPVSAQLPDTVSLDLRASADGGALEIYVRSHGVNFDQYAQAITYTIQWPTSSGATLGTSESFCPGGINLLEYGQFNSSGYNRTRFYSEGIEQLNTACPNETWISDEWILLQRIQIENLSGATMFQFATDGFAETQSLVPYLELTNAPLAWDYCDAGLGCGKILNVINDPVSLGQGSSQYAVIVQGHIAGCSPAIAGGTVTITSVQGTQPSVTVEVPLNENCFYQHTFLMDSQIGWFQVTGSCGNGTADINSGQYQAINGVATITLDLDCGAPTDCIACFTMEQTAPFVASFDGTCSSSSDPITTYLWDFTQGAQEGQSATVTFPGPGTYIACLNVSTDNGCWNGSCQYVTVDADGDMTISSTPCEADFFLQQTPNVPFSLLTTNLSTVPSDVTYSWQMPDGTISNEAEPSFTFPQSNNYQVYGICLTITGANCSDTHCDTIYVDPNGGLYFEFQPNWYWDCNYQLNGPAGAGTPCDDMNPNTINDSYDEFCNCIGEGGTSAYTVTIQGHITDCSPAIANGLVSIINPYDQTTLATTTLNANCFYQITIPVNSPMDSLWVSASCMDGTVATSTGIYQVDFFGTDTITVDLDCEGAEPTECEAGYWVIQAYDSANGQIEPIPFELWVWNLSTGTGNFQFLWNFGDGTTSSTPYPTHTYATAGPYELCLTIWDATGCTDTYCSTISVDGDGLLGMAGEGNDRNVLTLNVIQAPISTSIDDGSDMGDLIVFPNPATDQLSISLDSRISGSTFVSIVDLNGRLLRTLSTTFNKGTNKLVIPVNELAEGMYSIRIENGGSSITHRFVKSN